MRDGLNANSQQQEAMVKTPRLSSSRVDAAVFIIDINQFRVVFDDTEVGLGRVEILDEVIPYAPLPDDLAACGRGGPDFDNPYLYALHCNYQTVSQPNLLEILESAALTWSIVQVYREYV